jgi:hypothetical protein
MTAFRPGASPPPVRTAIRFIIKTYLLAVRLTTSVTVPDEPTIWLV